jgi:hypothetical protein
MTDLLADITDIAGGRRNGTATVTSMSLRQASTGGGTIAPVVSHEVTVKAGVFEMKGLDPGPAEVEVWIGAWRQSWLVVIPDSPTPVELIDLVQQFEELPPPIVAQAWEAAQAARRARDEVDAFIQNIITQIMPQIGDYQRRAEQSAIDASASADRAFDVIPPATATQLGKLKLRGALGGTAEDPRIADGVVDFAHLSDVDPAPGAASVADAVSFAGQMLGSFTYNDGWSRETLAQALRDELDRTAKIGPDGKLLQPQVPSIAISEHLGTVNSQAAMLALVGERGDWCIRNDRGTVWMVTKEPSSSLGSWVEWVYPASPVDSVNGRKGAIELSSLDIRDSTLLGRDLMTVSTMAAARTAIGAAPLMVERGDWSATATYQRGDVVNANHSRWCYNAAAPSTPGAWSNADWMYLGLRVVVATSNPGGGVLWLNPAV